jgi:hypothetical protein
LKKKEKINEKNRKKREKLAKKKREKTLWITVVIRSELCGGNSDSPT